MENGHRDTLTPARPDVVPERPDAPRVTWRWWEAVAIFCIAAVVGGVIGAPAASAVDSTKLRDLILSICGEVALGGTAFLWLWLLHRRNVKALGVPQKPVREIGIGALTGLALYAVGVFVVASIVSMVLHGASHRVIHSPRQIPSHLSVPDLVLAGITVILCAPIAEELFFRGVLFRSIRARRSFAFAGVVSALCFGAVHYSGGAWQNALLLPITMCFVGLGLAWLYERRRNIVANIAAHAAFNVVGFLFIVFVANR